MSARLIGSTGRSSLVARCVVLVVILALGFAVERAMDSPDRVGAAEFDGRTWLDLPAGDGNGKLVLANGISGLVEAQAGDPDPDAWPVGMRFAGSDRRFTLLQGDSAVAVLGDGSHDGALFDVPADSTSVLGAAGIVTAGADGVTLRRLVPDRSTGDIAAEVVAVTGEPAASAPVVEADGDTWVLVGSDASTAVRIDARGRAADRVEVAAGAVGLLVIDGRVYVRRAGGIDPVRDGSPRGAAGVDGIAPTVADATDGAWATASGRTVTVEVDGDGTTFEALDPIRSLAVWHGAVWAVAGHVVGHVEGDELRVIESVRGPFEDVFTDGGRLWFVSATEAIAIDRRQQATVFALQGLEVQYCVDTCTPDDLNQLSDGRSDAESVDDPADGSTTTVATTPVSIPQITPPTPPPPPPPPPRPPTTAAPTTTATTQPPVTEPAATARPTSPPTAAAAPRPTEPAPTQPPATALAITVAPATSLPIIADTIEPIDPGPPQTTRPPETTRPPDTTQPPVTTSQPPVTASPGDVDLVLSFADGGGDTTATEVTINYGWDGRRRDCAGALGNSAWADVDVAGAADEWWGGMLGRGDVHSASVAVTPGTLTVTLSVCGRRATITRNIVAPPQTPQLTGLLVTPEAVAPGDPFTATVNYSYGDTWQATGASWTGGPCGAEAPLSGSLEATSSSVTVPTSIEGTYCVSVIVTFRSTSGEELSPGDAASVDVTGATTPATSTSTTTTTPGGSTTTSPSTTSTATTSTTSTTSTTTSSTTSTTSTIPGATTTSTSTTSTSTTSTSTTSTTRPPGSTSSTSSTTSSTSTSSTSTTTTTSTSTSTSTVAPPR